MQDRGEQPRAELPVELAHENGVCLDILEHMPVGVAVAEVPGGRFVWRNGEADRILGHAAPPISSPGDYVRFGAVHADGTPYEAQEYPLVRAVMDGEVVERESL